MTFRPTLSAALLLALAAPALGARSVRDENEARRVVILVNNRVDGSADVAVYYAGKRGIPKENICRLSCPREEEISRHDFDRRIWKPTLEFLRRGGFVHEVEGDDGVQLVSNVHYLVPVYGVPLKIREDHSVIDGRQPGSMLTLNHAAVDSELALLPSGEPGGISSVENPYYRVDEPFAEGHGGRMMLVSRLDGPSPEAAMALVDGALAGERYGVPGVAYFDLRGVQAGSYRRGDVWLEGAMEIFAAYGYPVRADNLPGVLPESYEMPAPAFYFGWYAEKLTGPFTREGFRFVPGAIAYHIHSWSATGLRNADRHWVAPLLARGAAASMGTVYEPLLPATPNLTVFASRLVRGYNFAESGCAATPRLSWVNVLVGDPLYRPFETARLREQIGALREDDAEGLRWVLLREMQQLYQQGNYKLAATLCERTIAADPWPVYHEMLADMHLANKKYAEAAAAFEAALASAKDVDTLISSYAGLCEVHLQQDQREQALAVCLQCLDAGYGDRPEALQVVTRVFELARQLGRTEAFERACRTLMEHHQGSGWARNAAGELWVLDRARRSPKRVLAIRPAAAPIKFDGAAYETPWGDVPHGIDPDRPLDVRACYDEKALYLYVTCPIRKDGEVKGDHVEILLSARRDYRSYTEVRVTREGELELFDSKRDKTNPGWRCSVRKWLDRWTAEFEIPYTALGSEPAAAGNVWGLNVVRDESVGRGGRVDRVVTSWTESRGGWRYPQDGGYLAFEAREDGADTSGSED